MPLHVDMAIEALEILPPVNADVWWGDRGIPGALDGPSEDGDLTDGPPVDGPVYGRDTITMPFFRSTSLVRERAQEFMTWSKQPPAGSHPGLVHVPRSTAREITPFVASLSETEVTYPPGAFFRVTGRGVVPGDEGTVSYESITAQEVSWAASAQRPAPVLREMRAADGRIVGAASFDDADWAVRQDAYARLDGATGFVSWERDAQERPVATLKPLPGGGTAGGTFFFASHGGAEGLALAEDGGGVLRDDGSYAGRLLAGVRNRGFRSVTVLACGPGDAPGSVAEARARAERLADVVGLPVHLEVGRTAVTMRP